MRAMILAAGRGERMRPLTDTTPKPLLKVGGKPLIVWHLERLAQAGFTEVVINHAYLGRQIEDTLQDGRAWGLKIQYSPEKEALETAGGIANALHLLGDEPFLVVNSDVFTDIDFADLKNTSMQDKLVHLVLVDNPPQHPHGDFVFKNGQLLPEGENKLTFSGVAIYQARMFNGILPGEAAKLAPLIKLAIGQGHASASHYRGVWHDIGTPERLYDLDKNLARAYE